MIKERVHTTSRAESSVHQLLLALDDTRKQHGRPVVSIEEIQKVDTRPLYLVRKLLLAAVSSGHVLASGDGWALTADGIDRVEGRR